MQTSGRRLDAGGREDRWKHRNPVCLEQKPLTPASVAPLGAEEP